MATKPLKSIKFPGLADTYTVTQLDDAAGGMGTQGKAPDSKAVKDAVDELKEDLNHKANQDGYYADLVSGGSTQLLSDMVETDTVPYNDRTAGGPLEIGDRMKLKEIVGVSLPVNQIFTHAASTLFDGVTTTFDGQTGIMSSVGETTNAYYFFAGGNIYDASIIGGHKYFVFIDNSRAVRYENKKIGGVIVSIGTYTGAKILAPLDNGRFRLSVYGLTVGTEVNISCRPQFFDLTAMFGTTIADYVYGLETATAGAGVAWLKSHFPRIFDAGYIPYNAGTLEHVSGLSAHKMVGFNQFDGEFESGYITDAGTKAGSSNHLRSKNYIPVLPNTTYCFTSKIDYVYTFWYDSSKNVISKIVKALSTPKTDSSHVSITSPNGAAYCMFYRWIPATGDTAFLNMNLSWDGERDGEYEPYEEHSYPLDSDVTLRGIPKLDANNNLYYDGDEYVSDGTVTRRYGIVDLGTLSWNYVDSFEIPLFYAALPSDAVAKKYDKSYGICSKYTQYRGAFSYYSAMSDKQFALTNTGISSSNRIYVYDTAYTDKNTFATAIDGSYLVYEKDTPTTEEGTPYTEIQNVSNWGTEEFVTTSLVPVGHETEYQPDLRAKVEVAPESPDTDGLYLMKRENGQNGYVAYLGELPSDPTTDGTYTLKCTVSSGTATKTWEADT